MSQDEALISIIFGTRPEAIKLAPVILGLRQAGYRIHMCVTAQHREMLDQVLRNFGLVPDVDLNLMRENQTLAGFTSLAVDRLDKYFRSCKVSLVLVQGDTTTVFCSALAAFYNKVPVGHVEAGLRTGDLHSPWPEEANRILTSRLTTLHFAPTERNRQNLLREGIDPKGIHVTGNTVVDALLLTLKALKDKKVKIQGLPERFLDEGAKHRMILITGHRRENFGEGFESICRAIASLAERFPDATFVYPVHLNPNVREPVFRILSGKKNVHLVEPLDYVQFVTMMNLSTLILSDSGGVQEEAPSLGKPVLIMRDTTERPEGVEVGASRLVGTDFHRIVDEASRLLMDREAYAAMSNVRNPYGDGCAAGRIVSVIEKYLAGQARPA